MTMVAPINIAATAAATSNILVIPVFWLIVGKNVDVELGTVISGVKVDGADVCERLMAVVVTAVVGLIVAVVELGGVYGVMLMLNCSDVEAAT